jgi:hypothetical protein
MVGRRQSSHQLSRPQAQRGKIALSQAAYAWVKGLVNSVISVCITIRRSLTTLRGLRGIQFLSLPHHVISDPII